MKNKPNWLRIIHIAGVVALILGAVDPLEGSVVIALGSVLLAVSAVLEHDRFRKLFIVTSALILTGVFFLFYLSSKGGFGGSSGLSWWYGLLVAPYPLGWLISIITLIVRAFIKKRFVTDQL
jgi:hypothetical protein